MKLVVAIVVCFTVTLSCSIDKRSGEYACQSTSQCDTGRTCIDGFCVVSGSGAQIDAPITGGHDGGSGIKPEDASTGDMCPSQCTTCSVADMTCNIDCTTNDCNNNGPVQCPSGYTCTIACGAESSCNDVDCTNALACTVTCGGRNSCQEVDCGQGKCDVTCNGRSSCGGTIDCSDSCACDVSCGSAAVTSQAPCQGNITCPAPQCDVLGGEGCMSTFPGCNTCQ
jgi:hypothetical protein